MPQTKIIKQAISVKELSDQLEEIVKEYQAALEKSENEKAKTLVEMDLYKAKVASLTAACNSLAESLKTRRPVGSGLPTDVAAAQERIRALEAERDGLAKALQQADQRIRELEAQVRGESPAVAAVEPAAAPVDASMAEESVPSVEPLFEPELPAAPEEEPEMDFEEQKQTLLMMQEELARLEARLQEE